MTDISKVVNRYSWKKEKERRRERKERKKTEESQTPGGDEIVNTMWKQLGLKTQSLSSLSSLRGS